jgi:hypothetical protein
MRNHMHTGALLAAAAALLGACAAAEGFEVQIERQAAGSFPPVASFSEPGPFATTQHAMGDCTVHRPTALGQGGVTHPVVLWGNGTTAAPFIYAGLLSHLASHGFIVAAANTSNAGDGSQMLACLDGVLAAHASPASPYFQRVDPGRVGASGHSQGGAGTIMAGRDPRVRVTAPLQPYIGWIPFGGAFSRAAIGQQQGPMFLVSGSADLIAIPGLHQRPVYDEINRPVFWANRSLATHLEPIGGAGAYRGPVTAWFRAWLMGDADAAELFGSPCTLCADPSWKIHFR